MNDNKCISYKGNHTLDDLKCLNWTEEDIRKLKTERGVSYTGTKKQWTYFILQKTYAQPQHQNNSQNSHSRNTGEMTEMKQPKSLQLKTQNQSD